MHGLHAKRDHEAIFFTCERVFHKALWVSLGVEVSYCGIIYFVSTIHPKIAEAKGRSWHFSSPTFLSHSG